MTRFSVSSCPPVYLGFNIGSQDCLHPGGSSLIQAVTASPDLPLLPFHFHHGSSWVSRNAIPPAPPQPPPPHTHTPSPPGLCVLSLSVSCQNSYSLSQVEKWFSSTQSGTFSDAPLPLAHFCVWAGPRQLENSSPSLVWVPLLACQQPQIFKAIMKMSSENHARALKGIKAKNRTKEEVRLNRKYHGRHCPA